MPSEQPTGILWWLRSHPLVWAAVIPVVSLTLTALVAAYVFLPILPEDVRDAFERVNLQLNSQRIAAPDRVVVRDELRRLAIATKQQAITDDECIAALSAICNTLVGFTEGTTEPSDKDASAQPIDLLQAVHHIVERTLDAP